MSNILNLPQGVSEEMMRDLIQHTLLVLVKRAGGCITVKAEDLDNAQEIMAMESNGVEGTFTFRTISEIEGSH
jgi:hypothetical protein